MKSNLQIGKQHAIRFNTMVVGETGSGKTTFLKTLFKSYGEVVVSEGEKSGNTVKIEEIGAFTLETQTIDCEVHLFDSPGYGDYINNQDAIETVKRHLEGAHRSWLATNGNKLTEQVRML
ncbi:Septin-type guanine nucleotide-binding (G) domain-containing protein [Ochromonadaceae sp. CCMP2298]|nr:Septin-type guanine nucleotide-binding (G) domain-containing protein [Ochromonadaceae sp. CCMP2298]